MQRATACETAASLFVRVEKQGFEDAIFSEEEMILIGQFFAVRSLVKILVLALLHQGGV